MTRVMNIAEERAKRARAAEANAAQQWPIVRQKAEEGLDVLLEEIRLFEADAAKAAQYLQEIRQQLQNLDKILGVALPPSGGEAA